MSFWRFQILALRIAWRCAPHVVFQTCYCELCTCKNCKRKRDDVSHWAKFFALSELFLCASMFSYARKKLPVGKQPKKRWFFARKQLIILFTLVGIIIQRWSIHRITFKLAKCLIRNQHHRLFRQTWTRP